MNRSSATNPPATACTTALSLCGFAFRSVIGIVATVTERLFDFFGPWEAAILDDARHCLDCGYHEADEICPMEGVAA